VVLINHPEIAPSGAGEPSIRPVAAAIANAIFDATGVRIRRVPFSPDRVKAALS
jgi:CO/xanthine dehydrogenase Mo-binding subunit